MVPVEADVRDVEALHAAAADGVVAAHGSLDVVVAGAAVMAGGSPLWETDPADLRLLWETDAMGVWNTAHATVPHLLRSAAAGARAFVAIASAAGERGLWHLAAYCMAKHAVVGVVRGLAADLDGHRRDRVRGLARARPTRRCCGPPPTSTASRSPSSPPRRPAGGR